MQLVSAVTSQSVVFEVRALPRTHAGGTADGSMAGKGMPGIICAPLQHGPALPKEYKPAVSHHELRSALNFLAFLCIAFVQVTLISAQSTEVFSLWFTDSVF